MRDRAQQVLQPPGIRQAAQPAPGQLIQPRRVDLLEHGADPRAMIARSSGCGLPPSRASTSSRPGSSSSVLVTVVTRAPSTV